MNGGEERDSNPKRKANDVRTSTSTEYDTCYLPGKRQQKQQKEMEGREGCGGRAIYRLLPTTPSVIYCFYFALIRRLV